MQQNRLEGIVTQTDLIEAIARDLPDVEGEEPDCRMRRWFPLDRRHDAGAKCLDRLGLRTRPMVDEVFTYEGWRLEIVDMDRRRIDKLLAHRSNQGGP